MRVCKRPGHRTCPNWCPHKGTRSVHRTRRHSRSPQHCGAHPWRRRQHAGMEGWKRVEESGGNHSGQASPSPPPPPTPRSPSLPHAIPTQCKLQNPLPSAELAKSSSRHQAPTNISKRVHGYNNPSGPGSSTHLRCSISDPGTTLGRECQEQGRRLGQVAQAVVHLKPEAMQGRGPSSRFLHNHHPHLPKRQQQRKGQQRPQQQQQP